MTNENGNAKTGSGESKSEVLDPELKIEGPERVELKKELGLPTACALIMSAIIGSGIFISPKEVLRNTGSVGMCLCVWAGSGILAIGGALCFAELGTMIHKSGGEYVFLQAGIHNVVAYLWIWTVQIFTTPAGAAIKALTFAEYTVTLLPTCGSPRALKQAIAASCILTAYLTTAFSSKVAARLVTCTTIAKVAACAVVAVGGIVKMAQGNLNDLPTGFEGTESSPSLIALSFYSAVYTYDGWAAVTTVTEELKNPRKMVPRAMAISLGAMITLYMLMIVSYLSMMTKQELLDADAVGVLWGDRALGPAAWLIPFSVMVSTFGSSASGLFGTSRICFAAARDKNFPEVISFIQVNRYTPFVAMTFLMIGSLVFILPSDPGQLINFVGFFSNIFQGLVYVSLLILRWKKPDAPRSYKAPIPVAVLMVLLSIFLAVLPLMKNPRIELLYGLAGILAGLVFYVPCVVYDKALPGTDRITMFIQLVCNVAPPPAYED
ncbi:b(0,+)-type amino acid transporter 1 [Aplysia californica]|uniref:B(0,+)-type amino acid transporter 1 n=1 Tax=Aplysia californica TaxID=6500 RepID=A0ABM0JNZ6_APLCA|nr:b(0,+)-type amino acid transporter 1 [Aplysia californica]